MTVRPLLARLRADRRGVAAVEFVLVLPLFVLLLLGSFEIMRAAMAHKKTQKIAYTVDNLITKAPALDADLVRRTLEASAGVLSPFDTAGVTIDVAYRYIDATGTVSEQWTSRYPASEGGASAELPETYGSLREVGYLSTRVRYAHAAAFPSLFFATWTMDARSTVRPRPGTSLRCADC